MQKAANFNTLKKYIPYVIFGLGIGVYLNTLTHEFTQDDAIAIYKNEFTTQGIAGVADLFTKDTFHGFFGSDKSDLVSGGRYRPLTFVYFAFLWEIFGNNPLAFHLSSVLFYGGLCVLLYSLCLSLFAFKDKKNNAIWAALSALIFTVHPIHTEAVANVKGLDEIWSLGLGLLSCLYILKYVDFNKVHHLLLGATFLFLGILSKENAVTFLAIIPITVLFFRNTQWPIRWKILLALGITFMLYMALRISVIGFSFGDPPLEMMNNPFIKVVDGNYYPFTLSEKWASIIFGLGKYIGLLFLPHPLTHDYYPRHFEMVSLGDIEVLLAIVMYLAIIAFAIVDFRKKSLVSYSALFYLLSIFLTSNIIFPIGTHLSERFLFMPSAAFAMLIGFFFMSIYQKWNTNYVFALFGVLMLLFIFKTIDRNQVWQSDYVLFTTDVHTSPNSAKIQNAAGGAMITRASQITNEEEQKRLRTQAKKHLKNAINIHPSYKNAHLLLGNAHFGLNEYEEAIKSYEKAIQLDFAYKAANDNLVIAYREGARYEGSQRGNIPKAIQWLQKADVLLPGNYETISLLGIAYGNNKAHNRALEYFKIALKLQPENTQAHLNISNAYLNVGNSELSNYHRQQANLLKKK